MTPAGKIGCLALAGVLGTLARYFLSGFVQRAAGEGFPFGTLAVNALGCLAFGFVWALAEGRFLEGKAVPAVLSPDARAVVLVGFLGAFTTFSSFAFETGQLLRDARYGLAAANLLAQNTLGIAAFFLGLALGKLS